ncbi:hypothetical protein LXL04_010169, partial [Taraxacum kok-saghyz]
MEWDLEICPSVRRELEDMKVKQRFWAVYPCGYQQFEVRLGDQAYGVDLIRRVCDCRGWQLTGIPCLHAMAAIANLNQNVEDYVDSCFTKNSFLNTYSYSIQPMNGSTSWPKTTYNKILPPVSRRLPGRPKTKRKNGQFEKEDDKKQTTTRAGRTQRCSYCQAHGHKKHKCPRKGKIQVQQVEEMKEGHMVEMEKGQVEEMQEGHKMDMKEGHMVDMKEGHRMEMQEGHKGSSGGNAGGTRAE